MAPYVMHFMQKIEKRIYALIKLPWVCNKKSHCDTVEGWHYGAMCCS